MSESTRAKLAAIYGRRQESSSPDGGARGKAPRAPNTTGVAEASGPTGGRIEEPSGDPQGPTEVDLSLFCERVFLSGLSSSRIVAADKEEEDDEG
jgi:hypothetical protein